MTDAISPTVMQLPQWVSIAKELGVPTIFGAIIGYLVSFISYKLNINKENKKWRQEVAQQILKEVYSYNAVAINELQQKPTTPELLESVRIRFVDAVKKLNEAEALADLFVSPATLKKM